MPGEIQWPLGLLVLVVLTAAAVNRFAPHHRPRLRRVAILYLLYVAVLGAQVAVRVTGHTVWAERLDFATDLLAAFNVVNIVATLAITAVLSLWASSRMSAQEQDARSGPRRDFQDD